MPYSAFVSLFTFLRLLYRLIMMCLVAVVCRMQTAGLYDVVTETGDMI